MQLFIQQQFLPKLSSEKNRADHQPYPDTFVHFDDQIFSRIQVLLKNSKFIAWLIKAWPASRESGASLEMGWSIVKTNM